MRCLFAIHSPRDPRAAVFAYVLQRSLALERDGVAVEIKTPQDFASVRRTPPRFWPLVYPLRLAAWLGRQSFDLAIFHSYAGWATNLLRSGPRRRTVTQFHGLEPLYYEAMRRERVRSGAPFRWRHRVLQERLLPALLAASCRRSDAVFCLNRAERAFLLEQGWGRDGSTLVVPNCVERSFFVERAGFAPARLLFVGQWIEGKGTRYLARAFDELATERPQLELWCVGTRRGEGEVRGAFAPPVRARVHVLAETDAAGVREQLSRAGIFVFPTLSEGSSLALLEAMAAGLPIVATAAGAAADLLSDGASALLVPAADAGAIARGVRRLLDDDGLRASLGRAARTVAAEYEWERRRPEYVALVRRLAAS